MVRSIQLPPAGVDEAPAPLDGHALALGASAGRIPYETLRHHRENALTARVQIDGSRSVVMKFWNGRSFKGALRRITATNNGIREWRALNHLYAHRVAVPRPLQYIRLRARNSKYTEALLLEDLGSCSRVLDRIKSHHRNGEEAHLARIEHGLIELTLALLRCRVLDIDHRLNNFLFTPNDRLVRVDLEHGRIRVPPPQYGRHLGRMLGTLIGTYAFAVQPETDRASAFGQLLARRTGAPIRSLQFAERVVGALLEQQRQVRGIDTQIRLGWLAGR